MQHRRFFYSQVSYKLWSVWRITQVFIPTNVWLNIVQKHIFKIGIRTISSSGTTFILSIISIWSAFKDGIKEQRWIWMWIKKVDKRDYTASGPEGCVLKSQTDTKLHLGPQARPINLHRLDFFLYTLCVWRKPLHLDAKWISIRANVNSYTDRWRFIFSYRGSGREMF